jgi:hypothetical protein
MVHFYTVFVGAVTIGGSGRGHGGHIFFSVKNVE